MKITIQILIICQLLTMSCGKNQNIIKGEISDIKEGVVYILDDIPNKKTWYCDTVDIKNGKFKYLPNIDRACLLSFVVKQKGDSNSKLFFSLFYGDSDILIKVNSNYKVDIKGGVFQQEYETINRKASEIFENINQLNRQISKYLIDNKSQEAKVLSSKRDSIKEILLDTLLAEKEDVNSPVISYFLYKNFNNSSIKIRESFLKGLPLHCPQDIYITEMISNLKADKKVAIGSTAPDFELYDIHGNLYNLSDYRGNYVLLDFSASWCGWCKKELPYLKQVYGIINDTNMKMFTVSLDKNKSDWLKDVNSSNIPWKNLSDCKGFEGVGKQYNIHGIPEIILISPEGKILLKNLRGEKMVKTIKKITKQ